MYPDRQALDADPTGFGSGSTTVTLVVGTEPSNIVTLSVADSIMDPGSGAFLTPRSGIRDR